jgi:hypothetical protein
MNVTIETRIKTRIFDVKTRKVIKESKWQKNLLMDFGLNALAKSTSATTSVGLTTACKVGDGTTPTSISSGAVTFTQATNQVTASAGFFTSAMVGYILKYGTGSGGIETYITAFSSSTLVTVDTSATVGATVGTVWAVNQTALVNFILATTTYETTAGSCGTSFSTNSATHKRTYNFAVQINPYNVNEIGYFSSTPGSSVYGRIVLSSTDVVAPTNFYQVILSVVFTYTPASPTAVGNVGTNIDTSGNAMLENINNVSTLRQVQSDGTISATSTSLDDNTDNLALITATYTQNATTGNILVVTRLNVAAGSWVYGGTRGKKTVSFNTSISTAGETMFGIGLTNGNTTNCVFDVKFTSTFTLPTGTFLPQTVFSITYGRVLTN